MSVLLRTADRTYLVEPGERLETDLGVVAVPEDVAPGDRLESHLGEPFLATRPRPTDLFDELDRSGAPMIPRDVGLVIGLTGVMAGDDVLDVGTGTGILAITLASLGAAVRTYERDAGAAATARENVRRSGVDDRVTVIEADATGVDLADEAPFDLVTLDTADAAAIAAEAGGVLRSGGSLASYSPFVEAARDTAEAARTAGLVDVTTIEPLHRTMDFDERGSRPSTAPVGHTGYLTVGTHLPFDG